MTQVRTLDLGFYGTPNLIAAYLAPTGAGFSLFDPGPASCLDQLEQRIGEAGFELRQLEAVFCTHVHLDHAGAAGRLAEATGCRVFCHPKGATHLRDPEAKLLPSAERLYGDMMEPLWGRTAAVPAELVCPVDDGQRLAIGALEVVGWHTPGHAVHHAGWQLGGDLVTGDVAGVRFPGASHVLPPMPPPDIDVDAWRTSLDRLRSLEPQRLLLTHFGAFDDASRHLDELEDRIVRWTEMAARVVRDGGDRDRLGDELRALDESEMATAAVPDDVAERYRRLCPVKESSAGLYRYCAQRAQSG